MNTLNALLLTTTLAVPLAAEDFRAMAQAIQSNLNSSPRLAVACHYANSRKAVERLAQALGGSCHLTVIDIHNPDQAGQVQSSLAQLHPDLLVLLPDDLMVRDGSFAAHVMVNGLRRAGIPSAGTFGVAVEQGALFAIGEGTKGRLVLQDQPVGTIGVQGPSALGEDAQDGPVEPNPGLPIP